MRLLRIFCVLMFAVTASMYSQSEIIDSLLLEVPRAKSDSLKVKLLNCLSSEYSDFDTQTAAVYANKALNLSRSKKLPKGEAAAWFNLGNVSVLKSDYPQALKCYATSQGIYEGLYKNDKSSVVVNGLARTYASIGIVCNEQNDYPKALEYFFKALKLFTSIRRYDNIAATYNGIGVLYESQKEYEKALLYYEKAYVLQQKEHDYSMVVTLTNIGNIYLILDKDQKAFMSFKEAEKQMKEFGVNDRSLGELNNSYGNYYRKKGQYDLAAGYYQKALNIFNDNDDLFGASASLEYLGHIAEAKGEYGVAEDYYKRSSADALKIDVIGQVRDSEKALSELFEKQGKTKEAFLHYKKYSAANDSIVSSDNIKALVREEMNFEFERREAQRKLEIEKKQALYNEQSKRHKLQLLFSALLGILIFGFVFLIYNRRQIKKNLTLQRDLAEYEQKALHLQMNPHFVFNCLGAISGFIVQNGTDSAIKYLSKFSKLMRLTLEYSKEPLIPIDKETESLQNYLELEQLRFNQIFDFTITKDQAIEDDTAIPPLLIQPFVENAIIHGIVPKKEKGNITVNFALEGDSLVCTVTDDGIGISKSKEMKANSVTVHRSMALEITKKRLEVIQAYTGKPARVEIADRTDDNGVPGGTKITLYLPIQYLSDNK